MDVGLKGIKICWGREGDFPGQGTESTNTRQCHCGSMFWNPCHQKDQALRLKRQAKPDGRTGAFERFSS